MNAEEMRAILTLVKVPEFEFRIHEEHLLYPSTEESSGSEPLTKLYLQGHYIEPDVTSGEDEPQSTRKWILSEHMTKSELVQTAFKCYQTSLEHQARESFTYKGKRVFSPHYNVDVLAEVVGKNANLDYRRTKPVDTKSRHRTEAGGNVFVDLGFPPDQAQELLRAGQNIRKR